VTEKSATPVLLAAIEGRQTMKYKYWLKRIAAQWHSWTVARLPVLIQFDLEDGPSWA
jgi:hypothetical protein